MTNFNQTKPVKQNTVKTELSEKENDILVEQLKMKQRQRLHRELSLRLQSKPKVCYGR